MKNNYQNTSNDSVKRFVSKCDSGIGRCRTVVDIENDTTTVDLLPPPPPTTVPTPLIRELGGNPGLSNSSHIFHPPPTADRTQGPLLRDIPSGEGIGRSHPPRTFTSTQRLGIEFDFTAQRFHDPFPSLMLRYWTARSAAATLQTEKQMLQLQLRSLQHHLSLHRSHVKSTYGTKEEMKLETDTCREALLLLDVRRSVLIDSHLASLHGSHAEKYRTLLMEHLHLQDQFRQIAASHMATRYSLQKLIIDASYAYSKVPLQTASPINGSPSPVRVTPKCSDLFPTNLANHTCDSSIRRFGGRSLDPVNVAAQITKPVANSVVQNRDTPSPVPGSSADPRLTTASSRLTDSISHTLSPPDLYYPPDVDRPTLSWEMSLETAELPEDVKPYNLTGEMAPSVATIDRLIPEKDGHRVCVMCGKTLRVPSDVGLGGLQALLDHLEHVHPRFWGKQVAAQV